VPSDPQPSLPTELRSIEELLRAAEARGLRWTVIGRLALIAAGGLTLPVLSSNAANTAYTALLLLSGIALAAYSLMLLRKQRKLRFVGYAGVSFDLFTMTTLSLSWYFSVGGEAVSRGFVVKNELILLCLIYIVINSLAVRPLYPLVITAGSIILHLVLLMYALGDPRLVISYDIPSSVLGPALHPGLFGWRIMSLLLIGGALSWLARLAHRTIRAGVELEHANEQIREKQAELVMQGKMAAVASLVAGLAHEINNPLGVVMSSLGTAESCVDRISEETNEPARALEAPQRKALTLLKENIRNVREAAQRIGGLVTKLKDFVGLDQAEVQNADLEAGIEHALALIPPDLKQRVTIVKEFGHPPAVRCRPKEINQVVMTVLRNACEAIEETGTLRIRTAAADSRVTMEFADSGKGMPAEQLERLFDIRFAAKDGRVAMSVGLPLARTIIDRHGGSISAESGVGTGTLFRISLPLQSRFEDKS
jgi:signal transduction histidine kinase